MTTAVRSKAPAVQEEFAYLSLDDLYQSPWNPRKQFDTTELAELAESIREQGIHTPLLVRPSRGPEGLNGRYEIGAGARRYLAAAIAKLEVVPVRIRHMDDATFLDLLHTENPLHAPLAELDEAYGLKEWMDRAAYDVPTIAAKLGRDRSWVYKRLKLLELIPDGMDALRAGEISGAHALLIAPLTPKDQGEALTFVKAKQDMGEYFRPMTAGQLRVWIERELHLDLGKAPFDTEDAALLPVAGSCVACPKRSGFNPDLFPELKSGDVCTDRECFTSKVDAVVKLRKSEFRAVGQDFVQITENFRGSKTTLGKDQYEAVASSARGAVPAIVTDGPKRGEVTYVRPKKERPAEESKPVAPPKPKGMAAVPEKERRAFLEDAITKRAPAILKAVKKVIGELKISDEVAWNFHMADLELYTWHPLNKRTVVDGTAYGIEINAVIHRKLPGHWNQHAVPTDGKACRAAIGFSIWERRDAGKLDKELEKEVVDRWKKAEKEAGHPGEAPFYTKPEPAGASA